MKPVLALLLLPSIVLAEPPASPTPESSKPRAHSRAASPKILASSSDSPDQFSEADQRELLIVEASQQIAVLKEQLARATAELVTCQNASQSQVLEQRRKKVLERYHFQEGDRVMDNGRIMRKK